jgi:transmembrane sensor
MSVTSEETQLPGEHASDIEERAAAWLMERHGGGVWRETDQAELDAWLATSPANLVTFWRLEAALERTHRLHALQPAPRSSQRFFWPGFYRVAAALAVAIVLAFVATAYFVYPPATVYTTPVGGRETITLADGSRIELNTDTVLRARIGTYRRVVSLDKGEAYFQVKHDAGRPFVVAASGHRLTDLGTKFLVRSGPDRFEVAVFEGKVEFESQDGRLRQPLFLGAGDVATGAENTIYVAKKPRRDLTAKLGWQRGVLIFDHTTLADAAAEFNRYNREKILIADSDAAQRMIGGTFPADDVGAFTRLAHEVFGLHVENHGTETVISR